MARSASIVAIVAIAATPAGARAADLWVDTSLAADCVDYDVAARACGPGDQTAFRTLAAADAAAAPGDVVNLRTATFGEPFVVTASGTDGAPVVFRAHAGELVRFTGIAGADGAILLDGRAWVELAGLVIEDVGGWVRVVDSHHIVLRANKLARATIEGTRGSVKLLRSDDCTIIGNTIDDGNDNITIVDSERARVLDNVITRGRHSLISVRCSSAGVFRGNLLYNPIQKAVEVYDCEGSSSDDPVIFDATRRNLWEGNGFVGTAPSDKSYDFNAMQLAGQDGIVRRNVYVQNLGGGVHLQVYPDEALANHGNRVYHNTFHDNRCFALAASASAGDGYHDNVVTANLLFKNADCAGAGEQLDAGGATGTLFIDNTLSTRDPGFVDPAGGDFGLVDGSPVIDGGPWLTRTAGAGRGTALVVLDARFFHDGAGIPGEVGDVVQLEGASETARVVAVDLPANTLTLDVPLTWNDGQGVALAYAGLAPDPGAYEHGLEGDDTGGESSTSTGEDGSSGGDESGVTTSSDATGAPTSGGDPGDDTTGSATTGSPATGGESDGSGCGCRGAERSTGVWTAIVVLLFRRRRRVTCSARTPCPSSPP